MEQNSKFTKICSFLVCLLFLGCAVFVTYALFTAGGEENTVRPLILVCAVIGLELLAIGRMLLQRFESRLDKACDLTLGVLAPMETRIARIASRDNISEEYARLRAEGGKADAFFRANCMQTVDNDGDLQALEDALDRIYKTTDIGR